MLRTYPLTPLLKFSFHLHKQSLHCYTSVGGIRGLADSRSTITPTAVSSWRGSRASDSSSAVSQEDFREVIYYLPQGAHLHPGEAERSVMVEWGERSYYGFKRVSVNLPAFSLTQRDQLLIYDSFLLEGPLSPPETTDPASKALLRGSELLFKMETVYNAKREQLKKLPVCPVMVQAIKNK